MKKGSFDYNFLCTPLLYYNLLKFPHLHIAFPLALSADSTIKDTAFKFATGWFKYAFQPINDHYEIDYHLPVIAPG